MRPRARLSPDAKRAFGGAKRTARRGDRRRDRHLLTPLPSQPANAARDRNAGTERTSAQYAPPNFE
jgi:hypothetical protein